MKFLHVRHATSLMSYGNISFLIDPVLAKKAEYPPIAMSPNLAPNPLSDLNTPIETLLNSDVILCTHTHNDHFDKKAIKLLDKSKLLLCQSEDEKTFISYGFKNIIPIENEISYKNIIIKRVPAKHGHGLIGNTMGIASGYILSSKHEPTVYFLGDTIYTQEVKNNILKYMPDILVINGGSPKFIYSSHIVMNNKDIEKTLKVNPNLSFIITHLDSFNHCIETRKVVKNYFTQERLEKLGVNNFFIPEDNQCFQLFTTSTQTTHSNN